MTRTEERLSSALQAWADSVPPPTLPIGALTPGPHGKPRLPRRIVLPLAAAAAVVALVVVALLVAPGGSSSQRPASKTIVPAPSKAASGPDVASFRLRPTSPLAEVSANTYFYWTGGSTCVVTVDASGKEASGECGGTHPIDLSKPIVDISSGKGPGGAVTAVLVKGSVTRVVAVMADGEQRDIPLARDATNATAVGVLPGVSYDAVTAWAAYDDTGARLETTATAKFFDSASNGPVSSDIALRPVLQQWPGVCEGRAPASGVMVTTDKHSCYGLGAPLVDSLAGATASIVPDAHGASTLTVALGPAVAQAVGKASAAKPVALVLSGFVVGTTTPCAGATSVACAPEQLVFTGVDSTLAHQLATALNS